MLLYGSIVNKFAILISSSFGIQASLVEAPKIQTNDGRKNTIIVEKDGKNFWLMPLVKEQGSQGKDNGYLEKRLFMCSTKEFLEEEN